MKAAVSMASSEAGLPSNIGTTGSGRSTRGDLCGWSGCDSASPPVTWPMITCLFSRSPGCSAIRSLGRSLTPTKGGPEQRHGEREGPLQLHDERHFLDGRSSPRSTLNQSNDNAFLALRRFLEVFDVSDNQIRLSTTQSGAPAQEDKHAAMPDR